MLNDHSTPLSLLETRRSGRPREMVAPGPSEEEMERILTIAARVPDHGKLFPWRFVIVPDSERPALALKLVEIQRAEKPDCTARHDEAAECFRKALELTPDYDEAKDALADVEQVLALLGPV